MLFNITVTRTAEFQVEAPDAQEAELRARIMASGITLTHDEQEDRIHVTPQDSASVKNANQVLQEIRDEEAQKIVNERERLEAEAQDHDRRYLENLERCFQVSRLHYEEPREAWHGVEGDPK